MKPSIFFLALGLLPAICDAAPAAKPAAKKPVAKKPAPKPHPRPKATLRPSYPTYRPPEPTPTPVSVPLETGPKTWALLVGVSQYQNSQISGLRFPAKDAAGLRDALVSPTIGGIPAKQVLLLTDADATRDKIMGAVDNFLRPNVKEGDKVIVFLAGHGVAKGTGLEAKSYFLPTDVRGLTTAAFDASAVSVRALADSLGTLPASQFAVFVDACREDPTPGRGVKANGLSDVLARGIVVVPQNEKALSATFFACSIGQRAFEDERYGHGVFTNWILEGLKQGAIAQKPDGAVDMGRLSSYVTGNVAGWAKQASASGDFEITQTPQLVVQDATQQLVLLNVKRPYADTPIVASLPRLFITTPVDTAQISIDGVRVGAGSVEKTLAEGEHTVTLSAVGYAPVSRSVKALGGYENQVMLSMQPLAGGGAPLPANDQSGGLYNRAMQAQEREQYEIAEQGFNAAIAANPRFTAAYESLGDLHRLQNRNLDAISDMSGLVANSPNSAQTYAMLSLAYNQFALKGAGDSNSGAMRPLPNFGAPKNPDDAAKLARNAAQIALKIDPNSPIANLAQGYALAALDTKGKNKRDALAAWGKAAFLDPTDAANQMGLGYGIRFYALQLKDDDAKRAEIGRAIAALNEAIKLRPNYYEAHRELAFCYIALGNNDAALKECKLARANRGAASDGNEIAGIEVAMSGIHEQIAQNSTGDVKTANEEASQGYLAEAKETRPDLKIALSILGDAGLPTSLAQLLPPELQPLLDIKSTIKNKIRDKLGGLGARF